MSTNSVLEFRNRLNESPELQTELRSKSDGEIYAEDIVGVAKSNGFDFSVEDLEQTVSESQDTELSDFELEMVSGGKGSKTMDTSGGKNKDDEKDTADEPVQVSGSYMYRAPKIKIRRRW